MSSIFIFFAPVFGLERSIAFWIGIKQFFYIGFWRYSLTFSHDTQCTRPVVLKNTVYMNLGSKRPLGTNVKGSSTSPTQEESLDFFQIRLEKKTGLIPSNYITGTERSF